MDGPAETYHSGDTTDDEAPTVRIKSEPVDAAVPAAATAAAVGAADEIAADDEIGSSSGAAAASDAVAGDAAAGDALGALGVTTMEQDDLERNVVAQADRALNEHEDDLDQRRLDSVAKRKAAYMERILRLEERLAHPNCLISMRQKIRTEIEQIRNVDLAPLEQDIVDINERMAERRRAADTADVGSGRLQGETDRDFLIRTGKITPFAAAGAGAAAADGAQSHQRLVLPGIGAAEPAPAAAPRKRRRLEPAVKREDSDSAESGSEYAASETDSAASVDGGALSADEGGLPHPDGPDGDDGDETRYRARLNDWRLRRRALRRRVRAARAAEAGVKAQDSDSDADEAFKPHPRVADTTVDGAFKLPGDIYPSLFDYQKTCVQWLWELHSQRTGGIIGDEMGLGKTIQVISFVAGLHFSRMLTKPVLVVCPATVMKQWVNEFHRWWPPLRTVILHSSGSMRATAADSDDDGGSGTPAQRNAAALLARVVAKGHVVVTTYAGLHTYREHLLPVEWGYCVLDEGHKIRNPDANISLTCKQLRTPNRIILSGTPLQNNLTELWSLFDFVFPGRLGTLPVFQSQFSVPISIGGYANATNVQVQTAYKCACVLRDLISPYLLRRMKADVASDLPKKSEQVLFCKLTDEQRAAYNDFLKSAEMQSIFNGKRQVLFGVDILRKICNHPDLVSREVLKAKPGYAYGAAAKSGKLQVVRALLTLWKAQGHRALLFCQTRQMLDILEDFVRALDVRFIRMDGSTPIGTRQVLVDDFNNNPELDLFLLTTRVGGLGINLVGADRVIIYDPDWNPSTDVQARERAWRLGQQKEVAIYRLMVSGTIEEKIYHRQIFKQFLTNKILKDPKQRRFFKMNDMHDLFSLGDDTAGTETGSLFSGTERRIEPKRKRRRGDVDRLAGVASVERYAGEDDDADAGPKPQGDDGIMESLFAKSGVHSALEHDEIMDAVRPDAVLVEREASRVAADAARALKESRRLARAADIGTPTWTGRFGSAGRRQLHQRPSPRPGTAPASRAESPALNSGSILAQLRERRALERDG
ncbi:SNF2 family N-terminal domain-containing protein, partial [Dipodascopsis tothii]|uniref:SNF2 family N-terminal domain-containing protein n=1 Tax=Dipodascopsis tothii TaxID=44089 RepID=UPI0034CF1F1C